MTLSAAERGDALTFEFKVEDSGIEFVQWTDGFMAFMKNDDLAALPLMKLVHAFHVAQKTLLP